LHAIVTGAAGFIGSHLCEALLEQGWQVTGVDSLTAFYSPEAKRHNLHLLLDHPDFTWLNADVNQLDWTRLGAGASVIFHLAAQAGVRAAWGEAFGTYLRHNVSATQHLLEGVKACHQPPRVIFASSSSLYGNAERTPTPETATLQPISPYGVTKQAAERLGFIYQEAFEVPFTALRYFTVYGPRQRPDMAFHRFIFALRDGLAIAIHGNGQQTRDFTYVSDTVAATIAAAHSDAAIGQAINVAGGTKVTLLQAIDTLEQVSGQRLTLDIGPPVSGDARETCADTSKARQLLDFKASVALDEGLAAMWRWAHERPTQRNGSA
jgi:nucleoside-diphosphate-sugar epimerase